MNLTRRFLAFIGGFFLFGSAHATVPRARPPHLAEREEFEAARRSRQIDRLELFIARHPRSRYRPAAERLLLRWRRRRR